MVNSRLTGRAATRYRPTGKTMEETMKKVLFSALAILLALAVMSCDIVGTVAPTTPGGPAPYDFSTGVVFAGSTIPIFAYDSLYMNGDNGFSVAFDDITYSRDSRNSIKVDWSAASGWNGIALTVDTSAFQEIDLSGFDALSFWAKSEAATDTVDKIGFMNGSDNETYRANVDLTSTWQQFIIPIPESSRLTESDALFFATDGATGATMYLDDIKFISLATPITAAGYGDAYGTNTYAPSTGSLALVTGDIKNLNDVDGSFNRVFWLNFSSTNGDTGTNGGGTSINSGLASYMTWSTDNASVATVSSAGIVTAEAAGTANLTGTISGILDGSSNPVQYTYAVTVTDPVVLPTTALIDDFSVDSTGSWFDGIGVGWGDGDITFSAGTGVTDNAARLTWNSISGAWIDVSARDWSSYTGISIKYKTAGTGNFQLVLKTNSGATEIFNSGTISPTGSDVWETVEIAFPDASALSDWDQFQIYFPDAGPGDMLIDDIAAY